MSAEFELKQEPVLVDSFGGFGAQLNHHVFAKQTVDVGVPRESFSDLRAKVVELAPQLVRIFFNDGNDVVPFDDSHPPSPMTRPGAQADRWNSFLGVVDLAQQAGAIINITWQGGPIGEASMARFATVLEFLVKRPKDPVTNLRWVTIANEPNDVRIKDLTPEKLGDMYRLLHAQLVRRGLNTQIQLMGGDLLEGPRDPHLDRLHQPSEFNQLAWFKYIKAHLDDILGAYSAHIYWDYDELPKFHKELKLERRLTQVRHVVDTLQLTKPLYITEFGVRGKDIDKDRGIDPGNFHDPVSGAKMPISHTNIAPFQHAWFLIRAAQCRYAGMVKWDLHFGKYDLQPFPKGAQQYYGIAPPDPSQQPNEWQRLPMYHLLRLFTITSAPGWKVLPVTPETGKKHLVALQGGGKNLTILGLHEDGAALNTQSKTQVPYTIGGLPSRTDFQLLYWNEGGGGRIVLHKTITSDAGGVAKVTAPLHSVFALTTKKLPAL